MCDSLGLLFIDFGNARGGVRRAGLLRSEALVLGTTNCKRAMGVGVSVRVGEGVRVCLPKANCGWRPLGR